MLTNNIFNSMEMIVNSTGALVYVIDLETYEILYANEPCKKEFGEVVGKTCFKTLQKNENAPCEFCPIQKNENPLSVPLGTNFEWENKNSINGKHYLFNDRVVSWKDNKKVKIQVGIDITKLKALELNILEERNNSISAFKALLDSTIEGLIIYDENKICKQVNTVAPKLLGYEPDEMIGKDAFTFVSPTSHSLVRECIQRSKQDTYEAFMIRKDGSIFPAILRGHNLVLAGENIRVSAILDITDIKKNEEKVLKLDNYDFLTDLPNRILLKESIKMTINRSARTSNYNALLFINLDNFKVVNDKSGRNIGDMLLIEASNRIKKSIRKDDIVSRIGGDEFIVLIETGEINKNSVIIMLENVVKQILSSLQSPYQIMNNYFCISASIGIKLFNDNKSSIDDLLKHADNAMYNAKENGKNTFCFFDPKLQEIMENKIKLIDSLREAIENNSMSLHYQTQVISNKKIIGVEALIRWNHPVKGLISPADFIPAAEESGLIIPLGEWILNESVKQLQLWKNDTVKKHWRVSINVSSKQFEKDDFISVIKKIINKNSVNPNMLRLELTESLLIQNTNKVLDRLHKLKKMGLSLSIDDFGTGYSSLSYLKKLPIDELKIDQSFIKDLNTDVNDETITQTIISIGQKFGLEVIAEGVETQEQYEKLIMMGCQYFQGYLFSKPVEANYL